MKCYYHDNKEVIAACTECGRFICEACNVNINGKAIDNYIVAADLQNSACNFADWQQRAMNRICRRTHSLVVPHFHILDISCYTSLEITNQLYYFS